MVGGRLAAETEMCAGKDLFEVRFRLRWDGSCTVETYVFFGKHALESVL